MPAQLNGARVLLTGASGGIGNAIARALHARGAHVLATGRRRDQLDALARDLGDRIEPIVADLASADDVNALLERAGRVDVLVSNAGLPGTGRIESFSIEELDRVIDVNLRGPMQLARALIPQMIERGSGHIVHMGSTGSKVATGYQTPYNATKFGLRGFGLGLNDELHGTGVGATMVNPGFIRDAGMYADTGVKLPPGTGTKSPETVAAAVIKGIEKGRAEFDVAPVSFRFGGWLYGVAPGTVAALTRRMGGHKLAQKMAASQTNKR